MIKIEFGGAAKWLIRYLKPVQARIGPLLMSYIRFGQRHRRNFLFQSQGPISTNLRLTIVLAGIAVALALAWGCFVSWVLGEPLYKAGFQVVRTVVVFNAILIGTTYLVVRLLFRKRLGLFLTNLSSASHIWMVVVGASLFTTGLVASGPLYSDILEIRSGQGRETPFYRFFCEPIELELQAAALALKREKQVEEIAAYRLAMKSNSLQHLDKSESNLNLYLLSRREQLTQRYQQIVFMRQEILDYGDQDLEAWDQYTIGIILVALYMMLIVIFLLWNLLFLGTALRDPKAGAGGYLVAGAKTLVVTALSGVVTFVYVQAAEGTPIWHGGGSKSEVMAARAKAERAEPFCGALNEEFKLRAPKQEQVPQR